MLVDIFRCVCTTNLYTFVTSMPKNMLLSFFMQTASFMFCSLLISNYGFCAVSSQDGWSSLMVASQNGHVEVVDKLVQQGARVDLQNNVNTLMFKVS